MEILKLGDIINRDWFIFLLLKTGLRFSEALGLTPRDFDFKKGTLKINKTWDYKTNNGFDDTKNEGSKRVIVLDLKTILKFEKLLKDLPLDEPFFVEALKEKNSKTIYNATVNDYLIKKCREAGITEVTCHSLRHTHGSILIAEDVSMQSVSKRLGHTNTVITQRVYTHLIEEQKQQDDLKINSILNAF